MNAALPPALPALSDFLPATVATAPAASVMIEMPVLLARPVEDDGYAIGVECALPYLAADFGA